jgi:uncharacterized protein (UPF0332 family)
LTPEQAALLRTAEESLRAARLLAGDGLFDFGASRAYYSMFYAAEALLLSEGLSFSKHAATISALGKHFTKTGKLSSELHRHLIEAQQLRNVGDDDIGPGVSAVDCNEQIRRAESFVAEAQLYLDSADEPVD